MSVRSYNPGQYDKESKQKRGPIDRSNNHCPAANPKSKTQRRKRGKPAHMKGDLSPRSN